ncbi:methyltransferase N6AMT1-like isoform X1 [Procambarus clarkii]|uniref:methyltransferase N6AMT1-like isoform X1 n=1 Tax=Procambarus clarkii TaxID=6728 RepID=UPI001E675CF6|nr:methyltransferase N6AMT1-like [Procambarus clarkii]
MENSNNAIKTPIFSHITAEDLEHVYEPSEDSFLLIDALEKDLDLLHKHKPLLCLEVGSGSGVVITALGTALGSQCCYMSTDINPRACHITKETGRLNGVSIQSVCTDLVTGIIDNTKWPVDVLLFNPPYVVTPSEEVGQGDLEYTWAGGERGREVIDRLLPSVDTLLSPEGVFYLVVLKENDPAEIEQVMAKFGFTCACVLSRRTGPEYLSVLRFSRRR